MLSLLGKILIKLQFYHFLYTDKKNQKIDSFTYYLNNLLLNNNNNCQ